MKVCEKCGAEFPSKMVVDGQMRSFQRRRYCLTCSPFGAHNTAMFAVGEAETLEQRRVRREEERHEHNRRLSPQRATKRRQDIKQRAVAHKGGKCAVCGYSRCVAALEFHHRDPQQKAFSIAVGSMWKWETLEPELDKCDLLCANCHREAEDKAAFQRFLTRKDVPIAQQRVEERRRKTTLMAVALKGGHCTVCGYKRCARALEFHHLDPQQKAFAIRNGNTLAWARIRAEMNKCILLCANCHREAEVEATQLPQAARA